MKSRILLINFTQKESERLNNLPLIAERGYLSDIRGALKKETILKSYGGCEDNGKKRTVDDINFYSPYPIYEYKAVFLNLNNNQNIKKEFEGQIKKLSEEDKKDFTKYWLIQGSLIVIFLGDYNFRDLFNIGIPDFILKKVINRDITINSCDPGRDGAGAMAKIFNDFKSEVIMPTHRYIQLEEKSLFTKEDSGFKARYLYRNKNNEDLAIFIDCDKDYSPTDRPRVVVLPQFRNNIAVIEKFLRQIAKLYPKYLPELSHSDWVDSDEYYPFPIGEYDTKIKTVMDDADSEIKNLQQAKEKAKKQFKSLRGLLTQTGDELKISVIDVLQSIFKVSVIDSDKANKNSMPNEDIIIDLNGKKILAEIKGVKAENPSPLFIGQLWKHISQNKDKAINKGALILNHNLETDPKDRSLAYKGEHEKGLEDIIFIDTRVMFYLGLAVIDFGMSPEEAAERLLQQVGRVDFNLDEYLESKKTT